MALKLNQPEAIYCVQIGRGYIDARQGDMANEVILSFNNYPLDVTMKVGVVEALALADRIYEIASSSGEPSSSVPNMPESILGRLSP